MLEQTTVKTVVIFFLNIYYKLGYFSYIYLDFIYNMCIIYGVIWKKLKFMVVVVFEEKMLEYCGRVGRVYLRRTE